jgi:ELWxxDGT repeat protein
VAGTTLVKDIDPTLPLPPPPVYQLLLSIFPSFFKFQNELYFTGNNGDDGFELWKTNGTEAGTVMVKDINPGPDGGSPSVGLAVTKGSKFYFSATTADEGTELWESNGTEAGTVLLKDIATGPQESAEVVLLPNFAGGGLFQGSKFFLLATTPATGIEYFISDGTEGGTTLLKDINPGMGFGFDGVSGLLVFTNSKFYFLADDGTHGSELWQTDGTESGTTMVADVNPNGSSGSEISFASVADGHLYFFGTDGDAPGFTDFFRLDAAVLPLHWLSIEAKPSQDDIVLTWKTADEEQTGYFAVERSSNGINYSEVGTINAAGAGNNTYVYRDAGAMRQAAVKKWFYRVRCIDIDGKASISRVVSVAIKRTQALAELAANPVTQELIVLIRADANDRTAIRVLNAEGKLLIQKMVEVSRGQNNISTDVGHLPNGSYLVQVIFGGSTTTQRFLIQR